MATAFGTCPKHNIKFRGRCPRCHSRRPSSRQIGGRRQRAIITERLVRIDRPAPTGRPAVMTKDVADRWLRLAGKTWAELTDQEYAWLISRSSLAADELNQRLQRAAFELAP